MLIWICRPTSSSSCIRRRCASLLRNIAQEPDEEPLAAIIDFAYEQSYGKPGAILAQRNCFTLRTDYLCISGKQLMFARTAGPARLDVLAQVSVMLLAVGRRHENRDVLSQHFLGTISKGLF